MKPVSAVLLTSLGLVLGACSTSPRPSSTQESPVAPLACTYAFSYTPASYKTAFTNDANLTTGLYECLAQNLIP
ncbi:hypothetical protein [Deinococcus misasensis]|uniref:hypothetical protein n=1 Tax=Deinococcus misasensis TaxID=392413 RepID=UPI0012F8E596|nr:hypothetical protein [Deinococcus misasensis]